MVLVHLQFYFESISCLKRKRKRRRKIKGQDAGNSKGSLIKILEEKTQKS